MGWHDYIDSEINFQSHEVGLRSQRSESEYGQSTRLNCTIAQKQIDHDSNEQRGEKKQRHCLYIYKVRENFLSLFWIIACDAYYNK